MVDFNRAHPRFVDKSQLIEQGILNKSHVDLVDENLFDPFSLVPDLLNKYEQRHGSVNSLKD